MVLKMKMVALIKKKKIGNNMRKFVLSIFMIVLFASESVYSAGLLSDIYANRTYDNYRHYSAMNLSPSMTTEVDQLEIGGSYSYLSKIGSDNMYFYILLPLGLRWTVGTAYYTPGMFQQEQINNDGTRSGNIFTVGERVVALNGSYRFSNFSLGMNLNINTRKDVNYIYKDGNPTGELNKNAGGTEVGIDIGATFFPFEDYDLGDLDLGLTVQNVTGPVLYKLEMVDTSGVKTSEVAMPNILMNYRYNFFKRAMTLSGDISLQSLEQLGASVDFLYEFPAYLGIGAGYIKGYQSEHFVSLSGELRLQHLINRLSRLTVQVGSGLKSEDLKNLDLTYKVAFMAKLYKTREELNAERMYNLSKVAPMKAYAEALEYYKKKLYWKAAFKFGYVIAKYPRFYNVDAASFYMASSFEKLNLNDIALDIYSKAAEKYSTSDWRAKLMVGVENINYKKGEYSQSDSVYQNIEKLYSATAAINKARYIAGNTKSREKDYDKAIALFDKVDTTSSFWIYAQYSKAIAQLSKDDKKRAIKSLTNVVTTKIVQEDGADKEIINKANIIMGHTYMEISKENKSVPEVKLAINRYSLVGPTSDFYDEALLGISWIFIKARKGDESLKYIDQLMSLKTPYLAEAYLLRGYAKTFKSKYNSALEDFDKAIEIASKVVDPTVYSEATGKRDESVKRMNDVGEDALKFALTRIKLNRKEKRDLLGKKFLEKLNNFVGLEAKVDNMDLLNKFKSNYQTVINDATYSKGVVSLMKLDEDKANLLKKEKIEEEKRNKEIKLLEQQMNEE